MPAFSAKRAKDVQTAPRLAIHLSRQTRIYTSVYGVIGYGGYLREKLRRYGNQWGTAMGLSIDLRGKSRGETFASAHKKRRAPTSSSCRTWNAPGAKYTCMRLYAILRNYKNRSMVRALKKWKNNLLGKSFDQILCRTGRYSYTAKAQFGSASRMRFVVQKIWPWQLTYMVRHFFDKHRHQGNFDYANTVLELLGFSFNRPFIYETIRQPVSKTNFCCNALVLPMKK